jgi:type IV pilus assembly protein PilX
MLSKPEPRHANRPMLRRQRGVVLLMALIVLLAMTLAGLALMRSVSTSNVIAGNMAFQQAATQSADAAVEAAVTFLQANLPILGTSITSGGGVRYLAYRQDPAAGQSWDTFWTSTVPASAINTLPADAAGNSVAYVIHRLCSSEGVPITVAPCTTTPKPGSSVTSSKGAGSIGPNPPPENYYRITTRVSGPRNTLSYVQVIVAM